MAFAEVGRLATSVARSSAQTATANLTLSAAPAAGQWIAVALYTNRGNIPSTSVSGSNNQVNSVACGSVSLSVIDSPTLSTRTSPTLYMAPYTSGMTTNLAINWTNSIATTNLAVCVLIFTGADTTNTSGYANFRTASSTGEFDGGGTSTFGSGYAAASGGSITWTNSSAIPTNYGDQGQPFIAAIVDTNIPTSATLQLARAASVFGVVCDSAGNISAAFGTPGTLPINSTTSVYNPAGATALGVIYGSYGNFAFSYTGISGGSLTGCYVVSNPYLTDTNLITAGGYAPIMLASTSAVTITSLLATDGGVNLERVSGFLTGKGGDYFNATAGSTQQGHVMIGAGGTGTTPCRVHLMGGTFNNTMRSQYSYALNRINGSNSTNGGGVIYTMVPSTRAITVVGRGNESPLARGVDLSTVIKSSPVTQSIQANGSKLVGFVTENAIAQSAVAVGIKVVDYTKNVASALTEAIVGSKFVEMLKSSAVATTLVSTGGKLVGFLMESTNQLTQVITATQNRALAKVGAVSQEAVALANKIYASVKSGVGVMEQTAVGGKLAGYINIGVSVARSEITSAKLQANVALGYATASMTAVGEKAVDFTRAATVTLGMATRSTSNRILDASGVAVAVMAIASYKVVAHLQFGSAYLIENATGKKVGEAIRSTAVSLVSATKGTKRAEIDRSGASTLQMVVRGKKASEYIVAVANALVTVGKATRVVLFNKSGFATLSQALSVASYGYTIAHNINVAFSETLENGLYREKPTAVSFMEDAADSYQEGQSHQ